MESIEAAAYRLNGLSNLNVILGKNGCGKSRLLKGVEQHLLQSAEFQGAVRYLSPERGGELRYDPNQEQQMLNQPDFLANQRRRNQARDFRQQSAVQFRNLRYHVRKEIDIKAEVRADPNRTFEKTVGRINRLLDHVEIRETQAGFTIHTRTPDFEVQPRDISSGESELISLSIECLAFLWDRVDEQPNVLVIDEPDLHLHPDLQYRFGRFLSTIAREQGVSVLIATHSTALVSSFGKTAGARVSFMRRGDTELDFVRISDVTRRVLPVFGAHPLSDVFGERPILLVEGEDDERIWNQAVRTSDGELRLVPREVGGLPNLHDFELEVSRLLQTIYDNAVGYSLRDGDGVDEELQDLPSVVRMRLRCRTAENLLLSDDVLKSLDTTWEELQERIDEWLETSQEHPLYPAVRDFAEAGYDRRFFDIKAIRIVLLALTGTNKPWEVAVGQAIGRLRIRKRPGKNSLQSYLGEKVANRLLSDNATSA